MTEFLEFTKVYGLPMALVVVFIYWSYRRAFMNGVPDDLFGL